MQKLWVSMPILRNIIVAATNSVDEMSKICAKGGISLTDLENSEMKLSLQQNCAIMEAALQISKDPFLGLHIGERTTINVLGITGYLMESSKDLLTALHHLQEYTATFSRLYYFGIEIHGEEAIYRCEPIGLWNDLSPETARQSVDIAFAGTMHILRLLTGFALRPLRVYYSYPRISDTSEHERILKCRPQFNQSINALIFPLADLQRNIIGYNREMNEVFLKMLQKMMSSENHSFIQQVRSIMMEMSRFGFPGLEEVAARMHITPRTLQRKLQNENTSFRAECEIIKQELAQNLLLSKSLSVSDISEKLGYTEQAAFHRAFKQWTGKTPAAFRKDEADKQLL